MSTGATSLHLPALSEAEFDVLGESVFCDDQIGINWRAVQTMAEELELQRRDNHNEKVLRALTLVEEHDQTQSNDAERAEFHRLEGKIDLLLELVTALVRDHKDGSSVRTARFNARGLCWDASKAIPARMLLDVDLYLMAQWPLTLKLYVRVVDSVAGSEGFRICTRIEGLSGVSRDWFGKLVFRRHRRSIAQTRARG
jgi:Atypical PilZ domain, cyclic di-GMP receptor